MSEPINLDAARRVLEAWDDADDMREFELKNWRLIRANYRALLDAASVVAEEPEWEYGSKGYCFDWDDRRCRDTAGSLSVILAHEEYAHGGNASYPVRRRKAGPWVSVEQGGE